MEHGTPINKGEAIMDFGLFNTWNAMYEGGKVPWDSDYRGGRLLEKEAYAQNWKEIQAIEDGGWDYLWLGCIFHGCLPPNPWERCHPVHVNAATWTTARLPPIPGEACHHRSSATP